MKTCLLAASAAIGICLFTGGCGSSSGDSLGGDVAALRQELDQLKAEVSRLKSRVVGVEARVRAPMSAERARPGFAAEGRSPRPSKERIEEMRRRHEERMRRRQEAAANEAAAPAAAKPAAPAAAPAAANAAEAKK